MDDRSLEWTGANVEEMTEFAKRAAFSFSVGSTHYTERWWHRLFNWISLYLPARWFMEWQAPEDPTVLEVWPSRRGRDGNSYWTTARPGDVVYEDGFVERKADR